MNMFKKWLKKILTPNLSDQNMIHSHKTAPKYFYHFDYPKMKRMHFNISVFYILMSPILLDMQKDNLTVSSVLEKFRLSSLQSFTKKSDPNKFFT